MTYYEYVGFNIGSWFVSKFVGKCPAVNASAFAIKREVFASLKGFRRVVSEDLDIAVRAFIENYKFKYTKRVNVYNSVHSNWKNWLTQRKRWSIGCALWFKEWYRELLKICSKTTTNFHPWLAFSFPFHYVDIALFFHSNLIYT